MNRTEMNYFQFLLCAGLLSFGFATRAEIVTQELRYTDGETEMVGYLAFDDSVEDVRPGVIVVHEWWGHNAYARKRVDMLAAEGYVAFALDMYGEGKTADHPSDAGSFSSEISKNAPLARKRFEAALEELKRHPEVDPDRLAALGYCFGGSTVLDMARMGLPLKGVISVHGGLNSSFQANGDSVKARILVCHGGADPLIPAENVEAFKAEMDALGADYRVEVYPGASHSFSNPDATAIGEKFDLPLAYSAEADAQSWADIQSFLHDIFRSEP